MRRLVIAALLAVALAGLSGTAQAGNPPANEHSPLVGPRLHTHHVITGNGECVAIDAVQFNAEGRGLHRGASEGEVAHGPCPTTP